MKHFIVEIKYTAEIEKIDEVIAEHRSFLQTGYDNGMLLCSGPLTPRVGGIIIARADSEEKIAEFFINDPYNVNSLADYSIKEFNPVKSQDFMKEWING